MNSHRTPRSFLYWISRSVLLCVIIAGLAGCGSNATQVADAATPTSENLTTPVPTANPGQPLDKVRVGLFGLSSDAAIFIAMERGYFAEQGIEIETSHFTALSDMIPALSTAQLDVGNATSGAALFNALDPKFGLKIVADNATVQLNNDGSGLVIRKELVDDIQSPADLKGLKISALADKATPAHFCLEKFLHTAGLTTEDIEMVQLPFPSMGAALSNGSVDGAMIVEPFLSTGLGQDLFVLYRGAGEMCPGDEVSVQVYSADFAAKTDLAQRFAIARLKGARDFNDAFFKNIDRAAIVDILVKHTALKDVALYENVRFTTMNPDGAVNLTSLESYLEWYVEHGFVKEAFDLSVGVDNSFAENAVKVLGPYK